MEAASLPCLPWCRNARHGQHRNFAGWQRVSALLALVPHRALKIIPAPERFADDAAVPGRIQERGIGHKLSLGVQEVPALEGRLASRRHEPPRRAGVLAVDFFKELLQALGV